MWAAATPAPLEQPGLGERARMCVRACARARMFVCVCDASEAEANSSMKKEKNVRRAY